MILLSHHQPYSRLSAQGPKLVAAMSELLGSGRIFAWYWAHEHRCVVYERHPSWGVHGRCLGHGGMPEPRAKLARFPSREGAGGSTWRALDGAPGVPASSALDSPNLHAGSEGHRFLANGYAMITLNGPGMAEELFGADGTIIHRSTLR